MIMNSIFDIVDEKIVLIETQAKRPSVIVLNESLFKQMQQEMMYQDFSQKSGKVRSPYALQVYKGIKVVASQVVETVEVYWYG